ncbi:hypothetical protein ET495_09255 [Xylanimonas allomyrinae]|uniref:Secreted protein n=1 Tax=Xylanimonas allomyrinae TaxID=2509459 RepID=A0A4P6EZB6_9MICO|nr:hypothetical protein [Xylanimonas allomyrinae]QAY63408.1 hypothetical protein ET495_09255 [Xylanimonas allomyrinae]
MRTSRTRALVGATGVIAAIAWAMSGCAGITAAGGEPPEVGQSDDATPADTTPQPEQPEQSGAPEQPDVPAPTETQAVPDGRTVVDVVPVGTVGGPAVVTAGGYVRGVIELGGTCRYTLTQGEQSVTGESAAEPDATTTWCANVDLALPVADQPWSLEMRYESPTSVGTGTVTSTGEVS